ncbi:alpha/beta fold hydrolase [Nocardioides montaniterrae]
MHPQEPVLLLHGMGCGPWVWSEVALHLPHLDLIPATIAGHRGGTPLEKDLSRPATERMVDDLERLLDEAGLDRVHVVGNSLGGWLALRLAERGRALSVLCLAPAGGWLPGTGDERNLLGRFALGRQVARRLDRFPTMLATGAVRRAVMRPVVEHREASDLRTARAFVRDLANCDALEIAIGDKQVRYMSPIGPLDVPATIVWSEYDRVLDGPWAQMRYEYLPFRTEVLRGVGHMPMLDDPAAVAALIDRQVNEHRRAATA